MGIPEMPEDLKLAKKKREGDLKLSMFSSLKTQAFSHLFCGGPMGQLDIAMGIDKKAILKEVLIELAGMMDKYTVAETEENIDS